ncbi:NO-inducible flavohemoprotein [Neobacillus ginsengisoli]|uniref:Flavohemoprotein n=1 Tax=Neobacillus ginsengisoli TaxID=904295 RepID=A0ABT9XVV4_9BACI|nr:NO-inducible flavohemoprotein [Neobacillus ginsengisoli]MDQ0199700.1 nitric oxide dioxygenase [Neobacillus ginsengisoli]
MTVTKVSEQQTWQEVLETVKALDPQKLEIIKATLPIVKEHGEAITKHFYKRMFKQHPELLNIFNQTHQITGHQPKALADAVYGAAANIEDFSQIMPVLERIGEKHRSLQIKPEHYPIVGENLLAAIKEVLGDAATNEIIDAWADAYGVISDVFIRMEDRMYKTTEAKPGGWAGFRDFVVDKKVKESEVITSFYLKPKDGKQIADFIPGQYITIKMDIGSEKFTHLRQYSLSDRPGLDYYRISVKREEEKEGEIPAGVVSSFLHANINEGDMIQITAPAGDFYLDMDSDLPLVLISGGVGLTPMMCMLNTTVQERPDRKVYYIHAAVNSKLHAFKKHVNNLAEDHKTVKSLVVYEKPSAEDIEMKSYDKDGFINLEWLKEILPTKGADFYFCGPEPFMKVINKALKQWGISEEHIHYEFFGSFGSLD